MSTKIEWADETWNPVTGCNKVSAGCKNCYAETLAKRFWKGRKFTDVQMHEDRLSQPYKFKPGTKVFVNSMSDLFHEDVPFEFIDKVFAVMAVNADTTFQILTKRPDRMLEYFNFQAPFYGDYPNAETEKRVWDIALTEYSKYSTEWPLPNVWLGVSVENQAAADERIPLLLKVPAVVRFLSCEPLLGEVVLRKITRIDRMEVLVKWMHMIHWVIVGGESGHGARPMHPDWVRSLRDQCQAADVPFFFKQWGSWYPAFVSNAANYISEGNKKSSYQYHYENEHKEDKWQFMKKVGKKQAGAMLDGLEYKNFPNQ